MNLFETIVDRLTPHPRHAQMVIGLNGIPPGNLDRTLHLLSELESGLFEHSQSGRDTEVVLVIRTGKPSCRDAVRKLTESGYNRLQVFYPPPPEQRVQAKGGP